ncbi:MAG: hypothetical protein N2039_02610 [Gemmataceae bacterium]|nr:hypothetical protein [Gemmataceae bacterium]
MKNPAEWIDSSGNDVWIEAAAPEGRFVFFETCISFLVFSMRIPSEVRYIPPGRRAWIEGLPFTVLTLLLGWWGLPWGLMYTPLALATNLSGGCDVTDEILARRASANRAVT